ncbi:LamG-like jellyroll fold domain-containing protein [uncultured Aquimarina sp.]|uniref:LamG domain-containing protein n=1 Tax=uncultured Aquimarina sp. TaxID=575652 RepID=UPI002634ACC9|nr:LamG-like jellyroll fold domain-containing protein [uncultured Aquimarina sp.]
MNKIKLVLSILILSTNSYAQTTIDGLTNYWSFDGSSNDSQGNNNGTLYGDVKLTEGKDGEQNTAYYFDGNDDYIQILSPQLQQITIAFWIKPDGIFNDMRILSSLDGSTSGFGMGYRDQTIQLWSPWTTVIPNYTIADQTKWSFICITIDTNKNVTGYLNGISNGTQNINFQWSTYLGIGRKFLSLYGYDFKGSIDEFMIFDKVLSQEEIQSLYNSSETNVATNFCQTIYCKEGKIGIKTMNPDMELTVKGKIHAEEVKIDLNVPAPDYVFKDDYNLISIEEVEKFILKNSHLPEIPSAKEFEENGVMQAEMDMNLLKKIEELTLYTIQQEKKIRKQNFKLEKQEQKITELESLNEMFLELQSRLEKLESEK